MDRLSFISLLFIISLLSSPITSTIFSDEPHEVDSLIRQVVSDGDDDHLLNAEHHFSLFKSNFGKTYTTQEEHDYRFRVFKANLRRAKSHQLLDPTAAHGVTKFSDLTPSEFRRQYLGLKPLLLPADAKKAPILPTNNLPTDFDWRDQGAVTVVKDQVFFFLFIHGHKCRYIHMKTFTTNFTQLIFLFFFFLSLKGCLRIVLVV